MAKYLNRGSQWNVARDADAKFSTSLPAGNYVVKKNQDGIYFLEEAAPWKIGRVYGDALDTAERILTTYIERECNTGVLAIGPKGTGKTMLTRLVSHIAAGHHDIPTLMVNDNFRGDVFNTFMSTIDQRCIVLCDEFEKVHNKEQQEEWLTLLDGVHQSNKLFLLTANDEYEVNDCLISRPGRIFYYLEYGALERAFVEEYAQEQLRDKRQVARVGDVATLYGNFTFDTLRSLVEEMNRYDEAPHQALKYLNIRMDRYSSDRDYELSVIHKGVELKPRRLSPSSPSIDPMTSVFSVYIYMTADNKSEMVARVSPDNLVGMRDGGSVLEYEDGDYKVIATAVKPRRYDPLATMEAMAANGYSETNGVMAL
jgi:hypothetical protein